MFVWLIPGSYLENPQGSTSRPKAGAGRRRKAATPRRGESGKAGRINPPRCAPLSSNHSPIPPLLPVSLSFHPTSHLSHPSQASEAKPGAPLQSRPHTTPPPTPPTKKMSTIHPYPPTKLPKINHPSPPLPCLLSTIPIHCAESGRRNPAQKAADPQQNSPRLNLPGSGA